MPRALRADTPLPVVDVGLVLLILLLVVTPLANRSVELPEVSRARGGKPDPARSRITLEHGAPPMISLDEDPGPLSIDALDALLRAIRAASPNREIVLRADRRVPYSEVKKVLRSVQDAGFPAVGLVAERTRRAGGEFKLAPGLHRAPGREPPSPRR